MAPSNRYANVKRPSTIGELAAATRQGATGQGDVGLPSDATPAPRSHTRLAMATPPQPAHAGKPAAASWSIQVGAYATREATELAIRQAVGRAPELLKHATAIVAAMPQRKGTLYRARLTGLEAAEARKACKLLSHCLTVPPGA
jgi:D-alanyl-D-alanine carboxypeptidase